MEQQTGRPAQPCKYPRNFSAPTTCRQLLRDKEVTFAGYKFPHPLDYHILVKVQTKGKKSPREVMDDALSALCDEYQDIQTKFQARCCRKRGMRAALVFAACCA